MDNFEKCMTLFKIKIKNVEVCVENIMEILRIAMEVVEISELKGVEQRKMALSLVRKVVVDAPVSDEKEKLMLDMIDQGVLGNTIDLVIDATKGEININKAVKVATGCCSLLCK